VSGPFIRCHGEPFVLLLSLRIAQDGGQAMARSAMEQGAIPDDTTNKSEVMSGLFYPPSW